MQCVMTPDWQLDELRARRNERLAELEAQRQQTWAAYNRAAAALSTPVLADNTLPAPAACTGCDKVPEDGSLVPWSGDRLCVDCVDFQLDLMAKTLLADMAETDLIEDETPLVPAAVWEAVTS